MGACLVGISKSLERRYPDPSSSIGPLGDIFLLSLPQEAPDRPLDGFSLGGLSGSWEASARLLENPVCESLAVAGVLGSGDKSVTDSMFSAMEFGISETARLCLIFARTECDK